MRIALAEAVAQFVQKRTYRLLAQTCADIHTHNRIIKDLKKKNEENDRALKELWIDSALRLRSRGLGNFLEVGNI